MKPDSFILGTLGNDAVFFCSGDFDWPSICFHSPSSLPRRRQRPVFGRGSPASLFPSPRRSLSNPVAGRGGKCSHRIRCLARLAGGSDAGLVNVSAKHLRFCLRALTPPGHHLSRRGFLQRALLLSLVLLHGLLAYRRLNLGARLGLPTIRQGKLPTLAVLVVHPQAPNLLDMGFPAPQRPPRLSKPRSAVGCGIRAADSPNHCRFWVAHGKCRFGADCNIRHGDLCRRAQGCQNPPVSVANSAGCTARACPAHPSSPSPMR